MTHIQGSKNKFIPIFIIVYRFSKQRHTQKKNIKSFFKSCTPIFPSKFSLRCIFHSLLASLYTSTLYTKADQITKTLVYFQIHDRCQIRFRSLYVFESSSLRTERFSLNLKKIKKIKMIVSFLAGMSFCAIRF